MKLSAIIFIAISFISCSGSDNKSTVDSKPVLEVNSMTDTTSLLKIGGCYAIEIKKQSFAGGILLKVDKEEEDTYYWFLLNGKTYESIPTPAEFQKGGIWGRKIPSGTNGTELTFDNFIIPEKDLQSILDKVTLVETIPVSYKNIEMIGSSRVVTTTDELYQRIASFADDNIRVEKDKSFLPSYPFEVYDWNNIILADNSSDIPTPQTIWRLSKKNAHPKAVELMEEDWFWDGSDDLSPFGNDDGNDSFYGFKDWREKNKETEPALFLDELEETWQMSFSHKNIVDESELKKVEQRNMFYRNVDRSIIAVALGQIVLEGRLSPKLKEFGINATTRAMTSFGMNGVDPRYQTEYKSRFNKILSIFNQF